jgi:acyl dehydratase
VIALEPGTELEPRERVVVREDVKAYADASGDQNPLHQHDAFARSVGFPGVIAHGMFTMGHLASAVGEWLPGAELRSMKAQFRSAVLLGDTIVAGGRVREVDPDAGTVSLDLWVTVDRDGTLEHPIKRAEVLASIARGDGGATDAGT